MLKVTDLHVSYGAIHAIHGISLEVNEGEIVSLIGANGAGKTCLPPIRRRSSRWGWRMSQRGGGFFHK